MADAVYGGQAVIEGVMMRGVRHFAVACRRANGEIALTCELVPKVLRPAWQKVPLLRGAFALVDAMTLGTKALFWAAKVAEADIPKTGDATAVTNTEMNATEMAAVGTIVAPPISGGDRVVVVDTPVPQSSRVGDVAIGSAMFVGLLFALCLIVLFPNLAIEAAKKIGWNARWQLGLVDGLTRVTLFLGYILLISRMGHVRRVFEFHGAEHKTINAQEAGLPLTVANAHAQSRLHPRCGTSFLFLVLLISTILFSPFYGLPAWARIPLHFALTLPVAGIAFELLRLAGKFRDNPVSKVLSQPGMWLQLLTTREPDEAQLAVAIESLRAVMNAEKSETPELSATATVA